MGIVAQFFPHATSMVSRLNSAQNSVSTAPAPVQPNLQQVMARTTNDTDLLQQAFPHFLRAARMSSLSLQAVTTHRQGNPPDPDDIAAIVDGLLDYFAALAIVTTGDPNTDAAMRVYCAYSFPAVVLCLDREGGP
jgi:serine/threonine-protein phosphatase 4 regulatory subunit 1